MDPATQFDVFLGAVRHFSGQLLKSRMSSHLLQEVTMEDFQMPTLGPKLSAARDEVLLVTS